MTNFEHFQTISKEAFAKGLAEVIYNSMEKLCCNINLLNENDYERYVQRLENWCDEEYVDTVTIPISGKRYDYKYLREKGCTNLFIKQKQEYADKINDMDWLFSDEKELLIYYMWCYLIGDNSMAKHQKIWGMVIDRLNKYTMIM